jgi:hypothetical protein
VFVLYQLCYYGWNRLWIGPSSLRCYRRVNPEITALAKSAAKNALWQGWLFGIPHPQTKSVDKGKLHEESIEHWAARFHSWMTSI